MTNNLDDGPRIKTVAIIGAGTAGREFALECLRAGYRVVLEDVMPANLRRAEAEFADAGELELALTVEDGVREADLAVDFVPDELESKLEIFSMMDRMAPPKTILCTPSEALSITDLASCVYRPERCFAVRGGIGSKDLRLLYPDRAEAAITGAVAGFFGNLGRLVVAELDTEMPMLLKNLAGARA